MDQLVDPLLQWDDLLRCYKGCTHPWVPEAARVGSDCIGLLIWAPIWLCVLHISWSYGFKSVWAKRPLWLRNFGSDEVEDDGAQRCPLGSWLQQRTRACLLAFAFAASLASALLSAWLGPFFALPLIPRIAILLLLIIERPQTAPFGLLTVQCLVVLLQLMLCASISWRRLGVVQLSWVAEIALTLGVISFMLSMPVKIPKFSIDEVAEPSEKPTSTLRSPEDRFSLWNWMSASWMTPLVRRACLGQLSEYDVWKLPQEFQHHGLHLKFRELKGSVFGRVMSANGPDLIITTLLGVLESVMSLVPIVLLKQLLSALDGQSPRRDVAVVYGSLILLCRLIAAQSGLFSIWFSRRVYERSRGEMITMIYEKTLMRKAFTFPGGLSKGKDVQTHQQGPASTGKILNLMRNDVYEVSQRFWDWPQMVTKPLMLILCTVLIWDILGPAALGGVLLIVVSQLINSLIIRTRIRWEKIRRVSTDIKLQIVAQFVESIRHLRWYDWQDKWLHQILRARQKELRYRVIVNLWAKAVASVNRLAASFFPVAAFYAYTMIAKQPLRVEIAFPALNLITMFNLSMNELPNLITTVLNAWVAMGRIEAFMAEPNKADADALFRVAEPTGNLEISMEAASFSWPGSERAVLTNASLTVKSGLTAICGKVGAGKTALLQALLGELDLMGGEMSVPREMIGYCAQTPWLQSMSIRENILFSASYDEQRYRQVLAACCLVPDLVNFRAGDLSLIGENGVGLSGGQKARVALARAVYSRARILLLDDPIAALDHQTAEAIIDNLFASTDLLNGRIVVFVTHRMDLLAAYADQILEVNTEGSLDVCTDDDLSIHSDSMATPPKRRNQDKTVIGDNADVVPDKIIEEEHRADGGVMLSVYWKYVKAGNLWFWTLMIFFFVIFRFARIAHAYFLKLWGEAYETPALFITNDSHFAVAASSWWDWRPNLPPPDHDARPWLLWFFVIALFQYFSFSFAEFTQVLITYAAGKRLFQDVMLRVANASFRFYDVTPVGRLMNRLTSDIGVIDGLIVIQVKQVAWNMLTWLASLFVIATTAPVFLAVALVMTVLFVWIFLRFLPASQSLRRLEMVSLSPLMSNFGTLLEGLTTVRAFRAQPHFQNRIIETTDNFQRMDHFYWSLQAWLQIRFDMLSALSTFALTMSALSSGLGAGTVGFTLSAAGEFVTCTHALCRRYGELQMQFVSVERVIELMELEQEEEGNQDPPASWPTYDDDIVFDKVTVRYARHLEPSLEDVSFVIPAGSTVAVTGRTGSGKSTLALTLLGTILPDAHRTGSIHIGKVNIAAVNKHALRQRITFVAQDPVLFPGSLRDNIDPLHEHSDQECEMVLRRVLGAASAEIQAMSGSSTPGLSQETDETIAEDEEESRSLLDDTSSHTSDTSDDSTPGVTAVGSPASPSADLGFGFTLATTVDGGGKNFSQGQRQLIGLARAVLRRSAIVILDEATASIDRKTAAVIQQVLREELRQSTVVTIAHRLEAVVDADYAIELDKGRVVRAGPVVKDHQMGGESSNSS